MVREDILNRLLAIEDSEEWFKEVVKFYTNCGRSYSLFAESCKRCPIYYPCGWLSLYGTKWSSENIKTFHSNWRKWMQKQEVGLKP